MRIFWKKNYENHRNVEDSASKLQLTSGGWGRRPQTPACLLSLTITTLSKFASCDKMRFTAIEKEQTLQ